MAKAGQVIAAGLLVGTTALTAMASQAADAGAEIANLSRAAGAGTTEFQKWAFGARSLGIEQDKLSGLLRDTRERVLLRVLRAQGGLSACGRSLSRLARRV